MVTSRPRVLAGDRRSAPLLRQSQTCRRSHRSTGPPAATSDSAEGEPPSDLGHGALGLAVFVAQWALWDGMLPSVELFQVLRAAGVKTRTAERALVELRVEFMREGFGHGSRVFRRLPEAGAFVLTECVDRWVVITPSRRGETKTVHMLRHWAEVKEIRSLERQREQFRSAVVA